MHLHDHRGANDCGHNMCPPEPTDLSTSCAGHEGVPEKNSLQNDIAFRSTSGFGAHTHECRTSGNSGRSEVDSPGVGAAPGPRSSSGSVPVGASGGRSDSECRGEERIRSSGSSVAAPTLPPSSEQRVLTASDPGEDTAAATEADPQGSTAAAPRSGTTSSSAASPEFSTEPENPRPARPATRLQSGIIKPKIYTDGTVR